MIGDAAAVRTRRSRRFREFAFFCGRTIAILARGPYRHMSKMLVRRHADIIYLVVSGIGFATLAFCVLYVVPELHLFAQVLFSLRPRFGFQL